MKVNSLLCVFLLGILILGTFIVGCGEGLPPGMPRLYPTAITVTYDDGKPLADASIIFYTMNPDETGGYWAHIGNTNAEGKAEMLTQGKYKGVPAAKYMATISKFIYEGEDPPSMTPMNEEEAKKLREYQSSGKKQLRYIVVAKDYLDSTTTPLKDIVVNKGKNDLTLKVGKEEKILMQPRSMSGR